MYAQIVLEPAFNEKIKKKKCCLCIYSRYRWTNIMAIKTKINLVVVVVVVTIDIFIGIISLSQSVFIIF